MLSVPVYNQQGEPVGQMEVDPGVLGGRIRPRLIKQAIVTYLDHQRQDSARTKGRADVEGSTRKLYRQKGTGFARAGNVRTPIRRGGGRAFAKRGPRARKEMPKKMRRLARNSAILAKMQANDVMVLESLDCPEAKTKTVVSLLGRIGADGGCVLATHGYDPNLTLSSRNIPRMDVRAVNDLNAYEVLLRKKLVFTRPALERLLTDARNGPGNGRDNEA